MALWTGLGHRVLGLATGKVLPESAAGNEGLSKISLLTLKQHVTDLRMLGLAIIDTPVRPDAKYTIQQLQTRCPPKEWWSCLLCVLRCIMCLFQIP